MPNLENQRVLHFEFQCQKLMGLYHNTLYPLILRFVYKTVSRFMINRIYLPLFQKISVKVYILIFSYV